MLIFLLFGLTGDRIFKSASYALLLNSIPSLGDSGMQVVQSTFKDICK